MLFKSLLVFCLSFFGLSLPSFAQFDSQPTFLPVKEAYSLSASIEAPQLISFTWQIAPGYYLYRHGFNVEALKQPEQTATIDLNFSKGIAKHDEFFGDVEVYYDTSEISAQFDNSKQPLYLTITSQGCADAGLCYPPLKQFFQIDFNQATINELDQLPSTANTEATINLIDTNTSTQHSLVYILLLALIGGTILNLMPCVFPVLSLKVLSFTKDKEHSHALQGLSYTLGVVISFIGVAATLIALRAAGNAIGWGFQLQTPWFVAALAYVFFLMGLSLSGYIELGNSLMGLGNSLTEKPGYSGSFFTGVLATVVASPCTAPFMGTALGYAITQDTVTALSVFAALGLGMALPLLLLALSPALLNKIPKPGEWMNRLKQLLAYPLYATALWLCWVAGNQTGVNGMLTILVGCLLLVLMIELWRKHWLSKLFSLLALILALSSLNSDNLKLDSINNTQNWQTYDTTLFNNLRAQQAAIFINLTADWCITCLANEKLTLSDPDVSAFFAANNIHYLKGDWTNRNKTISELLSKHGRSGIPLYIYYPAGKDSQEIILPQILRKESLLDTLTKNH